MKEVSGLRHVRGCEVIELRDAEGKASGEAGERGAPRGPLRGTLRTLVVALDTAQYQLDITRQSEAAGQDVYGGLNLLVRRRPKENNFKAILECIRDLMNEHTAVPEWLHDIFLGYGDPGAATYRNLPDALPTLDFKVSLPLPLSLLLISPTLAGHLPGRGAPGRQLPGPLARVQQPGCWRSAQAPFSHHFSRAVSGERSRRRWQEKNARERAGCAGAPPCGGASPRGSRAATGAVAPRMTQTLRATDADKHNYTESR